MKPPTNQNQPHSLRPVAVFTSTYVLAAAAFAIVYDNYEFLVYIVIMLILAGVVLTIHRRVNLTPPLLWCLSIWGLLHMSGGLLQLPDSWPVGGDSHVLYNLWLLPGKLKYDQLVHAYGFGITTWMCWQALRAALRHRGADARPTAGLLVLCVAAGSGFGAFNEVVEFSTVLMLPTTNVGGYMNNAWDLVANLIGAIAAAVWIGLSSKRDVAYE